MVAKQRIDATIDGLRYVVNAGEAIPPPLASYWKAANLEAKLRASGFIESDAPKAAPASELTIAGNPLGTRSASAKKETT